MRKQIIENLSAVAPAGEQFACCVHGMTGPSPWIDNIVVQALRKYYFVTLTNTSVIVNRAGRMANRPKEIVAVVPVQAGAIVRVKKGLIWSKLYLMLPGRSKPTKVNVHRRWNKELEQFGLAAASVARIPAQAG
ncbi:hypothetical protein KGA66_20635 [Actinocrinis puniceicyclus]|uniref:Uncharacterized protein n=1 Tax=Actinocrinis puniceicyclus TaxID=977794 RepID=A0A8J7WN63_9ACTN|nr:hypothetical protein [Actinocrinis puniceicyclus]MBS2965471.1 hypothetical protein [Actinocrinis puniceicyclus]